MSERVARGGVKALMVDDVDGENAALERANPLAALDQLAEIGDFKQRMRDIGTSIRVRRLEGRAVTGLVDNYIFTGAPGTGKVCKTLASTLFFVIALLDADDGGARNGQSAARVRRAGDRSRRDDVGARSRRQVCRTDGAQGRGNDAAGARRRALC